MVALFTTPIPKNERAAVAAPSGLPVIERRLPAECQIRRPGQQVQPGIGNREFRGERPLRHGRKRRREAPFSLGESAERAPLFNSTQISVWQPIPCRAVRRLQNSIGAPSEKCCRANRQYNCANTSSLGLP